MASSGVLSTSGRRCVLPDLAIWGVSVFLVGSLLRKRRPAVGVFVPRPLLRLGKVSPSLTLEVLGVRLCWSGGCRRFLLLLVQEVASFLWPAMVARGEGVEAFGVRYSLLLLRPAVVARGEEAVWYVGELECFSGGFRSLRPGIAACAGELV